MVDFNHQDLEILGDQNFLLAKRQLSDKIIRKLAQVEVALKHIVQISHFPFPSGTKTKAGKISKGENYLDLPYFVLDYPRLFSRKTVFSYRVMVWWGHEISCILHLSGEATKPYRNALHDRFQKLEEVFLCTHSTPWEYHFESENYQAFSALSLSDIQDIIKNHPFLKVAWKFPLSDLQLLEDKSSSVLHTVLDIINPDSQKAH